MGNLLLPGDPDFDKPVVMGDAYSKTPSGKFLANSKALDAQREKENPGGFKYANSTIAHAPDPWFKQAQAAGVSNVMSQPMWFSPLHTPQNWQIASKRREVYQWNRFWYENEPKVAAAIDFYGRFPMNGFSLECPNRKVLSFFEHHIVKKLKLNERFKEISSEYYMLGDVFIHTDIECEICGAVGVDPDTGERCNHPGGKFKRIFIMNPDWIEVQKSPLTDDPLIVLIPDDELQQIVHKRSPKPIYDRIPEHLKPLIMAKAPIPLSNNTTSHLKHMNVAYGTYGTSIIRRLFTTLAYKTKIMTANWIVAERLILPVRVVKIGSDDRPASTTDIADVQTQLAQVANDPNLTIVTHHNFEYDWYGAAGKILQITQEMEHIDKELLDGLMLNQALLNGEMCLTDDHEVLTADGYIPISEVTAEDSICEWLKEGKSGSYIFNKPQELYQYDNVPTVYEVRSGDKVLFKCTKDHKILIDAFNYASCNKWKAVTAQELANKSNLRVRTLLYNGLAAVITEMREVDYHGSVYCFKTNSGYFVARYEDTEFISGNSGYQSAQVGVETLIRRIESWRHSLGDWAQERVFKPVAEMQGFVDEEKSEEVGETVFLYPTIKWNDLELKDKTQYYQMLMQLHDKQVISTQTLLDEMGLNYDQEVKRQRYEQAQMGPAGAMMGQGGGPGGMAMPGGALGGGGGAPGGEMPGAPMSPMGDMGGAGGGMGDLGGGGMPPAAAGAGGKITKKGKAKQEEEQVMPMMPIKLTKIEQKMAGMLENVANTMKFNTAEIRMQFPVENPEGGKAFSMDFAIPNLKIGIEVDGEVWHSSQEQVTGDQERDNLLAQRGWTVLRFDDKAIEESTQQVEATINSYINKAMKQGKKHASKNDMLKVAYFAHNGEGLRDFNGNGTKYYEYLESVYASRKKIYRSETFGNRSKEEYFATARSSE